MSRFTRLLAQQILAAAGPPDGWDPSEYRGGNWSPPPAAWKPRNGKKAWKRTRRARGGG